MVKDSGSTSLEFPGVGDLWGGLAAAAVLLPQAMAFGVTLYAMGKFDASGGAYAGLIGTAILCIASGVAGGTRGLITAPTGPTLVLLGSALTALAAAGLAGTLLVLGLAATIALAGIVQFLIGISGGGRLIKYIPFPVVSGFMTGSAILMIKSQITPLSGAGVNTAWSAWWWLPAVAAIITIAAARLLPRALPQVPGPIAGLLFGTASFHALAAFHGGIPPEAWMIGALPQFSAEALRIPWNELAGLPWPIIVPAAIALAVLASLDTLLTAVVADVATGTRHDSRRELTGQGCGQVGAALFGGMAGAGTTAATVIAIKSGGGRWVGLFAGGVFLVLSLSAGEVGRFLPIGALAGVIVAVAIDVADGDILTWLKQRHTLQDAGIAILVTTITVFYDLMIAVAVGVGIAIALFIREQITAAVIHRRSTAAETRSIRTRPESERALLDQHGQRIIVYELRGNLFCTADRLIDELGGDLEGPNWIILNLHKVTRIDLTAIKFLQQIANRLSEHGGVLIVCELHRGTGVSGSLADAVRMASGKNTSASVLTFNGRDEALEFAETALLEALEFEPTRVNDAVALADNTLSRYLSNAQVESLATYLETRDFEAGTMLFSSGEMSDELFLVASGQVEIRLATTAHHHKRLAVYGAGSFFGELALLKHGPRAADALADVDTRCWKLDRNSFEAIKNREPALAIALLSAICDTLVRNQRWSTTELQRLSEW